MAPFKKKIHRSNCKLYMYMYTCRFFILCIEFRGPAVDRLCNRTNLTSNEYIRLLCGKADQPLPSGTEANNAWSFTSTVSHVWYLINWKYNFTFILDICYKLLIHKWFRPVAMLFLVSQTYCSLESLSLKWSMILKRMWRNWVVRMCTWLN